MQDSVKATPQSSTILGGLLQNVTSSLIKLVGFRNREVATLVSKTKTKDTFRHIRYKSIAKSIPYRASSDSIYIYILTATFHTSW